MKILIIAANFPPKIGGSIRLYYNLCKRLDPKNTVILTTTKSFVGGEEVEGWKEFDKEQNFKIYRLPLIFPERNLSEKGNITTLESIIRFITTDTPLIFSVLFKTIMLIKREKIDLLVSGEVGNSGWLVLILKRLLGKKYIVYVHGEEITSASKGRLWGKETNFVLKQAEAVISVSQFTSNKLIDMGIPREKIKIIFNGIDRGRFIPQAKDAALVERYKLKDKKVLLTVGRLDLRKGHDSVIKAIPKITKKIPNLIYLIVGEGRKKDSLIELVNELNIQKHVIFAGHVSEDRLVTYYNLCDVFIMPNRELTNGNTEGFGIVFLEANACGKPVISGKCGGVTSAVEDGKSGYLVDGKNLDDIATVAATLLSNESLAEKIGAYGQNRARRFGWNTVAEQFKRVCLSVVCEMRKA